MQATTAETWLSRMPPSFWTLLSPLLASFSVLMLLVGRQEGHLIRKNEWWGTGVVICLEQSANDLHMVQHYSWCHCHQIISCFSKIQNGLPFWCRLTQVILKKRPLNRCSVVVISPLLWRLRSFLGLSIVNSVGRITQKVIREILISSENGLVLGHWTVIWIFRIQLNSVLELECLMYALSTGSF